MEEKESTESENSKIAEFAEKLTALSHKYQLGITGEPVLFVLEDDDMERQYTIDHASRLEFA